MCTTSISRSGAEEPGNEASILVGGSVVASFPGLVGESGNEARSVGGSVV